MTTRCCQPRRRAILGLTSRREMRRGQSLIEFAMVALVTYMLLAAILTFGHALYVAQGLQQAADLAAREISRTPLPADVTFEEALDHKQVKDHLYSEEFLVFDLDTLADGESLFQDIVPRWPILNQQLAPLMIVDHSIPDRRLLRYPGALLETENGLTVGIPLVVQRETEGAEIKWVPVVEEIEPDDPNDDRHNPFQLSNPETRGIVALRINYPFQSAAMSGFHPNPDGPFEPTLGNPISADEAIDELNDAPGQIIGDDDGYFTYGGPYGLGAQAVMGERVRPYRRVISAQAIYRREVFE